MSRADWLVPGLAIACVIAILLACLLGSPPLGGAALQGLMRNPLAEPGVLGV